MQTIGDFGSLCTALANAGKYPARKLAEHNGDLGRETLISSTIYPKTTIIHHIVIIIFHTPVRFIEATNFEQISNS